MGISASMVKQLREKTGAPMMNCKKALVESNGDIEKAVTYLREKNLVTVSKKVGRATTEGIVSSYIHPGSKLGVMLELNCETDFVAQNDDFKELSKNIVMHIAALSPLYTTKEDVDPDILEKEKEIYITQAKNSGKPEKVWDKIVTGRMEKFFSEVCLMEQTYIKDDKLTITDVINELIAKLGENISIKRFVRYQLGEELS
ncbi:MAG: translation elongation factor Ts [Deltaproteobacteria bacterium]|jgi:elongation factor Ts|nr:translation elongation factor Ts [Deltaproteobacteria bacterium]MBW2651863.1 translation elongation factor Ts [Deltaproteobacteria bacterium]MCK5011824.1 translation elongation factor Ts [Deltaproteobacteria bacterium]